MQYLNTKNLHLGTSIFLVLCHLLVFLLSSPPNPTLLTGVFYGIIMLLSFRIWTKDFRLSKWLVFFLYVSLLIGLFGTALWAYVLDKWFVFAVVLISYLLAGANIWFQGRELWTRIKQSRFHKNAEEDE